MRAASSSGAKTPNMPHFSRHVSELMGVGGVAAGFFLCTDSSCRRGRTRAGEQLVRQHGDKEKKVSPCTWIVAGRGCGGNGILAPPVRATSGLPFRVPQEPHPA